MESLGKVGQITELFLHSEEPNNPMTKVNSMQFIAGEGILGNPRYYKAITKRGKPNMRHVSLIEEEMILVHKEQFDSDKITNATVRSNVITKDINLVNLVGKIVAIGDNAVVKFSNKRDPCYKMDQLEKGLMKNMMNGNQGVVAEIINSGEVKIGDTIRVIE